jgi:hypothetical protein
MPSNPPLMASGSRELKRPKPIPKAVRAAVALMVYGKLDDPDCKPLGFIEAAKLAEIAPDHMRRYLDRAEVRALLRSERRVFRDAICAGNEGALKRIRDTSANGMSVVASVRALEQIDVEAATRPSGNATSPGIVIRIITPAAQPLPLNPKEIGEVTGVGIRIIENEPVPLRDTEVQDDE